VLISGKVCGFPIPRDVGDFGNYLAQFHYLQRTLFPGMLPAGLGGSLAALYRYILSFNVKSSIHGGFEQTQPL
jgi:hypothetical protein